jgi:dolichyl-diphosphooligosaccharide--protein glycosyltransferase
MKRYVPFIICLGFVLGINIYYRSFPINFPQLKTQAKDIVNKTTQQTAIREIYKRFPQFYPLAKEQIMKSKLAEYNRQNRKAINKQIDDLYRQLKDRYQDNNGQTYLMELDCWHWGRYVDNVVRFGHPGDEVIYGEQWDLLMLAPLGFYLHWDQFLFYLSAFFYKVYKYFAVFKPVPLFTFLFYLPLLFAAVFIVVLFLFSFRYARFIGAVVSCLFIGLAPIFLPRSCAGWFDRDILNLLFPLLVTWTYLSSSTAATFKRKGIWICFSAFWVGIFCFTWTFWWFIFAIIIIYEFLSLGYLVFLYFYFKEKNLKPLKQHFFSLFLFLICSFLWIILLAGTKPLIALFNQIKLALILNKPLMASIWPNVYSTVGELRSMGLDEMAHSTGGVLLFASSILCMFILLIRALRSLKFTESQYAPIMILAIWFIAMAFASFRGIRFVVFLLLPLGVSLGWVMNDIYEYFKNRRNFGAIFLVTLVLCGLSFMSIKKGYDTAKQTFPLMNNTWYKVLNLIREKTLEQTIINSWWDYGDWFKVVAKRRVIFDGQSQDTPQAYWMGKVLLGDNEEEAIAILRMLNNGGNKAFEVINEHIKDPLQSVLLLETLFLLDPEKAQQKLLEFLPPAATEEVLRLLFSTPSKACFIVEDSMLPKMAAISYLGNWDFSKVYIAQHFNNEEKDKIIEHLVKLGKDNREMQIYYQEVFLISPKNLDDWLSRKVQFFGGLANGQEKDGLVYFDNGFTYSPKDQTLEASSGPVPRSLFVVADGNLVEKPYPDANAPFSVFVMKTEEGYKCIPLDRTLANTMFARLYFYNGMGLRHFIPFVDAQEGNNYIRVFNIAW